MAERSKIVGLSLAGAVAGAVLLVPLLSFITQRLNARQQNIHHFNETDMMEITAVILVGAALGAATAVAAVLRDDSDASVVGRICQYGGGLALLIAGFWSFYRLFSDTFHSFRDAFGVMVVSGLPLIWGVMLLLWGIILRQQSE